MPLLTFSRLATALTLTLTPLAALADGPWQGNWDTSYSDLNLLQDGNLVFGEYVDRGWIIGYTDPSGTILRGAWVHENSDRWGALEFRLTAPGVFDGSWVEDQTTFAFEDGTNWDGTRARISPGYFPEGLDAAIVWPQEFDLNALSRSGWFGPVTWAPMPQPTPTPTVNANCPNVAMDTGLSASNNPYVTTSGISNAATAPWTIYAQPPAAPLGSLAFTGGSATLQMDACVPLFGPTLSNQRRDIRLHSVVLSQRGDGDYQGTGWFHDYTAGIQGAASFYLTNPAAGQGMAALTITGEGGR
ncbi:hypothetical protein KUL25_01190 [Rhodobacteraceae bacterium N5(2021)]|uniref:Uncharacterized protein n=1 Tax=Gymnodinialimonas phycosphaerae TaxID=2841589 RepID=A0A975TVI3_9RHOB|nr:hypothetical protein [Gymnodinialimonas phycosphaerae]MBY4891373.1 hypothetical protein [Gymnodinialimonas phycosphaerae]